MRASKTQSKRDRATTEETDTNIETEHTWTDRQAEKDSQREGEREAQ